MHPDDRAEMLASEADRYLDEEASDAREEQAEARRDLEREGVQLSLKFARWV